jgi:hypothetical protein
MFIRLYRKPFADAATARHLTRFSIKSNVFKPPLHAHGFCAKIQRATLPRRPPVAALAAYEVAHNEPAQGLTARQCWQSLAAAGYVFAVDVPISLLLQVKA